MSKTFKLSILTPKSTFYLGDVNILTIEAYNGYVGILINHIPFVSSVKPNYFFIEEKNGRKKTGVILDGILSVTKQETKVICSSVCWLDEVDKNGMRTLLAQKEKLLKTKQLSKFERKKLEHEIIYYQKSLTQPTDLKK